MAADTKVMEAIIRIGGEMDKSVNSTMTKAGNSLTKLNKKLASFEKAALVAGAALTTAFAGAAIYAGKKLYDLGAQFQEVTNTIRIGTGATGEQLKKLEKSFEKVYAALPLSADVVATAIADINTLTGAEGTALEEFTHRALDAADMLKVDAKGLYTAAAKSFNAFGISAEQMADKLDFVWKVSQSTGTGMEELMETVQQNQTTFRSLGYEYEQAIALIGQLDKAGFETTDAMSALQKAVANMAKAGVKDMSKGLQNAIDKIKNAKTESEAAQLAIEAFGARGGAKMAKGIRDGSIAVDELVKALKASPETIGKAGDETDTLGDKWEEFKHKIELGLKPAAESLYNAFKVFIPILENLAEKAMPIIQKKAQELAVYIQNGAEAFKGWADSISADDIEKKLKGVAGALKDAFKWIQRNKDTLITIGKILLGVYATVKAFAVITTIIRGIAAAQWLWNAAMTANPIGIIIMAIAALVAAVIWLWNNWDKVVAWISGLWDKFAQKFPKTAAFLKQYWEVSCKALKAVWDWLCEAFTAAWDFVSEQFTQAWERMKFTWNFLCDALGSAWDAVCDGLSAAWDFVSDQFSQAWERMKFTWNFLCEALGSAWDAVCNGLSAAWDYVAGQFTQGWENLKMTWNYICGIFGSAWDAVCSGLTTAWDTVSGYFTSAIEWLGGLFTGLWDGIKSAFTSVFDSIPAALKTPINAVINIINGAINAINGIGFTIPDWVPGLGGKRFEVNIPNIPMLAKGGFTQGVSIAGEAGTEAVISFDPAYRKQNQGYLMTAAEMLGMTAVPNTGSGSTTYNLGGVSFSPVIQTGDNVDRGSILQQFRACMPDLMDIIEEALRERESHRYV